MTHPAKTPHPVTRLFWFACCVGAVVIYANFFLVYSWIQQLWGQDLVNRGPWLALGLLFVICLTAFLIRLRKQPGRISLPLLAGGLLVCALAMLLPDPAVPVKRIHVSQYLLLALLVRQAFCQDLGEKDLLLYGVIFTSLLGVHEEMIQGLHPDRTYGTTDILVNCCGALGGSLIWQGLSIPSAVPRRPAPSLTLLQRGYLFWLLLATLALVLPLYPLRSQTMELWPLYPLGGAFWFFIYLYSAPEERPSFALLAVSFNVFLLAGYPLLARGAGLLFY